MPEHILVQLAVNLAAAKIGAEVCERWLGQPAVLGEIVGGVLLGGSVLGWVPADDAILGAIAGLGAVFLLFEVGLESDLDELFQVGGAALWVAVAGVAAPFALGFGVASALGESGIRSVFVGAALTATSVGITARVFADLGALRSREARIVLGAAVADDVIGLIILAAVGGSAAARSLSLASVAGVTALAVLFLALALAAGRRVTPWLLGWASRMRARAAVSCAAVVCCLLLASAAETVRLAPIVGAFAAGLILAKTAHRARLQDRVRALADILVPVFFVMMGARMDLHTLNPMTPGGRSTLAVGGALLLVAIVGKVLAGLTVPGRGVRRLVVGLGMIPRGEVGLIFASAGLQARILEGGLYAAIVLVVVATTLVTPPLLKAAIGGAREADGAHPARADVAGDGHVRGQPLTETT